MKIAENITAALDDETKHIGGYSIATVKKEIGVNNTFLCF